MEKNINWISIESSRLKAVSSSIYTKSTYEEYYKMYPEYKCMHVEYKEDKIQGIIAATGKTLFVTSLSGSINDFVLQDTNQSLAIERVNFTVSKKYTKIGLDLEQKFYFSMGDEVIEPANIKTKEIQWRKAVDVNSLYSLKMVKDFTTLCLPHSNPDFVSIEGEAFSKKTISKYKSFFCNCFYGIFYLSKPLKALYLLKDDNLVIIASEYS